MFVYWLMFAIPAFGVVLPVRASQVLHNTIFLFVALIFVILLGLRFEVGADWGNHLSYYQAYYGDSLIGVILTADPGFSVLNWLSGKLEAGVYLVNVVCAALLMFSVIHFAKRQPLPWLALVIAVPYLIIVVSMGYVRQGVAIGFELLALTALIDSRFRHFLLYVFLGVLFHKSAILILPFALLMKNESRLSTFLLILSVSFILTYVALLDSYQILWGYYTSGALESEGGALRVWMNAVPALLLLVFRKNLTREGIESRVWFWFAVLSLACIPLVGIASTAVDRVALFLIPIQIFVFSRIHYLFSDRQLKTIVVSGVVLGYGIVQFVWLNFANQASSWVPYQFAPFTLL